MEGQRLAAVDVVLLHFPGRGVGAGAGLIPAPKGRVPIRSAWWSTPRITGAVNWPRPHVPAHRSRAVHTETEQAFGACSRSGQFVERRHDPALLEVEV